MTDEEWQTCPDPGPMLHFLQGQGTDRKLRLFACACCRRIWDRFPDSANRNLVATVEDHPDGAFQDPLLEGAIVASSRREHEFRDEPAYWAAKYLGRGFYKWTTAASAFVVAARVLSLTRDGHDRLSEAELHFAIHDTIQELGSGFRLPSSLLGNAAAETGILADLLRDIFGNPFRAPPAIAPSVLQWNGGTVKRLAEAAYEQRLLPSGHLDNARLAVLADALEEANSQDESMLMHLRDQEVVHVRGCFALDVLLEKT